MISNSAKTHASVGASFAGAGNTAPALYPVMLERRNKRLQVVHRELFTVLHVPIIAQLKTELQAG